MSRPLVPPFTAETAPKQVRAAEEAIVALSPGQFRATQQSATGATWAGQYLDNKEPDIYVDIVSGEPYLFQVEGVR